FIAIASTRPEPQSQQFIFYFDGSRFHRIPTAGLSYTASGVWFIPQKVYYIVGNFVYKTFHLGQPWQREPGHPQIFKSAIRGEAVNDVLIVGAFGLVSHFNGVSWHHFTGELPQFYGTYGSMDYKGGLLVAGGWRGEKAIVLLGGHQ
ncbi:hypothetical protein D6779_03890, partial [Candidatus Parcubacteria bacterium]